MPLVHRHRAMALAVALASLTTIVSGAVAPVATAAMSPAPTTVSAASAAGVGSGAWFVDSRTRAERRAEVAVPHHPKAFHGRLRETRAAYRTHAGDLAVPVRYAFGHSVTQGQAVTLDGRGWFLPRASRLTATARQRLARLAPALREASAIRCEGYTDYVGLARLNDDLARRRSAVVCNALAARNRISHTTITAYGPRHPVVVGGNRKGRLLNRRVVVQMTGTRPTSPPASPGPSPVTAPDAPTHVQATATGTSVTVAFTVPTSDGGTPVTGYEVRVDSGSWVPVTLLGDGASFLLADQPAGSHTYQVRAVNAHGVSSTSDAATAQIASAQPDPPTIRYFGFNGIFLEWQVMFVEGATHGATVTGWEASVDGGPWVAAAQVREANGETAIFPCSSGFCGWSYTLPVRLRAVTATGSSQPSAPYAHDQF